MSGNMQNDEFTDFENQRGGPATNRQQAPSKSTCHKCYMQNIPMSIKQSSLTSN